MKYNPAIHHRRSIRLKGYDYSQAGLYFITICCPNRQSRFGNIVAEKMELNEYGQIAHEQWIALPERFYNCELHEFVIMPNHMHGIIQLTSVAAPARAGASSAPTVENKSISDIVGAYKSLVSVACLNIFKSRDEVMGKLWQRDYYEQIIKDDRAYSNISEYIRNNPSRWHSDDLSVAGLAPAQKK